MASSVTCLQYRFRNVSGKAQFFAYLGRRGVRLANQAEYFDDGNLLVRLQKKPWALKAFFSDLQHKHLELLSSPSPVFYDAGLHENSTLKINNGAVAVTAPCWGEYISSAGV